MKTECTYLINESIDAAVVPDSWKIGTITPLPKGRISLDPGDWRPVSVLPCQVNSWSVLFTNNLFIIFNVIIICLSNRMAFERDLALQPQYLNTYSFCMIIMTKIEIQVQPL